MQPSLRSLLWLAVAAGCLGPRPAAATSADDSGARVVLPLAIAEKLTRTTVYVENLEARSVELQVRYVGERSSATPGLRTCQAPGGGNLLLPAGGLTTFDPAVLCALNGPADTGLLVLITKTAGIARISARARLETLDPRSLTPHQSLAVDGLALGRLDTTDNTHVAIGLRQDLSNMAAPLTSDCYVGTFFDGSGAGGVVAKLKLLDGRGQTLGNPLTMALRPFELVRVPDVFKATGAGLTVADDARAEFVFSGGGDAVLAFCTSERNGPQRGLRSLTLGLAQVVEPTDETTRRHVSASSTPLAGLFTIRNVPFGGSWRVVHGVALRHPDRVRCSVSSSSDLVLTAVSPDRNQRFGGSSATTGEFSTGPRGAMVDGWSDVWGLEVTWGPSSPGTIFATYTLSCSSGNGASLADEFFRN